MGATANLSIEQLDAWCPVGSRWSRPTEHSNDVYRVLSRQRDFGDWHIKVEHTATGVTSVVDAYMFRPGGAFVRLPDDAPPFKTAAAYGFTTVELPELREGSKLVLLRHAAARPQPTAETLTTTLSLLVVTAVNERAVSLVSVDALRPGVFRLSRGTLAPTDPIWNYLVYPVMNIGHPAGLVPGLVLPGSFWVRAPALDAVYSELGNQHKTTYEAEFEPVMVIDNRVSIRTVDVDGGGGDVWVPSRFLTAFVPIPADFLSPKQHARLLAAADGVLHPRARRPAPSTALDATQQKLLKDAARDAGLLTSEEVALAKARVEAAREKRRERAITEVGRLHRARDTKARFEARKESATAVLRTPDGATTMLQFDPTLPPTTTPALSTPEPNNKKDMKMNNTNRTTTVWATMDTEGDLHIAFKRKDLPDDFGGAVRRLQLPADLAKDLLDGGELPIIGAEHPMWNDIIGAWTDGATPPTRKTRVKNQATALVSAAALGGALATMDKIGDLLLDTARKFAPQVPGLSAMLEHPMGREAVKILMAVSLHTVAYQTDLLPKKEIIARVAEWQISMSTMKLVAPQLELLTALVSEIVTSGERLPLTAPSLKMFSGAAEIVDADVTKAERARA